MLRIFYPIFRVNSCIFSKKFIENTNFYAKEHTWKNYITTENDVFDDIREHKVKGKTVEKIDKETLELLERLSLVNIENE